MAEKKPWTCYALSVAGASDSGDKDVFLFCFSKCCSRLRADICKQPNDDARDAILKG